MSASICPLGNDGYNPQEYSFANNINTHEGGTHLSGFRSALTRTINSYAQKSNLTKDLKDANISGDESREGMTAVISVKLRSPQFEGQTKTKLGNTEVNGFDDALDFGVAELGFRLPWTSSSLDMHHGSPALVRR